MVLQTYDIHETGISEDNIDGGEIVNGTWLNIATALPLRRVLASIGWMPERLGANRENHIVRATAVVNSVIYGRGRIAYTTFDAPVGTMEVLRLAFVPKSVMADGQPLAKGSGYAVRELADGDAIVTVRHEGSRKIVVAGDDPQQEIEQTADLSSDIAFEGNQVRIIGPMGPAGGLADVTLDGVKQLVPIDSWNPSRRDRQTLYYRNGLAQGPHTLRVAARGVHNPYSAGNQVSVQAIQFSNAEGASSYPTGTGPTQTQRMIFGYTGDADYRDSQGQSWRPATELITRTGANTDSVTTSWWRMPAAAAIDGTPDRELYRYGVHGREFWVNVTVGPGSYHVRLKFAAGRDGGTEGSCLNLRINGREVAERVDVAATAGGTNRAVDLVFNQIVPRNGIIEVRFTGANRLFGGKLTRGEAFVQALEVGPGDERAGAEPVSVPKLPANTNLLLNPGFEDTAGGQVHPGGVRAAANEWTYDFDGTAASYIGQERDFNSELIWGDLPEYHSGRGALRVQAQEAGAHSKVYQDVEALPNRSYAASVWVKTSDLHGAGFGHDAKDSASLEIQEMDASGDVIRVHPKAEVKAAGPYRNVMCGFSTDPRTARVRFLLETVLHCTYRDGYVTYDECSMVLKDP
jgi:hypothetical protein